MGKYAWGVVPIGALVIAGVVACSSDDDSKPAATPPAPVADAAPVNAVHDDAQIADAVVAANQITIDNSTAASASANYTQVLIFANRVLKARTDAVAREQALYTRLMITMERSSLDDQYATQGKSDKTSLLSAGGGGAGFDRIFLELVVDEDRGLIAAIDGSFLPAVQNADLRAELTKLRGDLSTELTDAQALLVPLYGGGYIDASAPPPPVGDADTPPPDNDGGDGSLP